MRRRHLGVTGHIVCSGACGEETLHDLKPRLLRILRLALHEVASEANAHQWRELVVVQHVNVIDLLLSVLGIWDILNDSINEKLNDFSVTIVSRQM